MSGDVIGRAVNAVQVPPQAERFASVAGVDLDRLVLNVTVTRLRCGVPAEPEALLEQLGQAIACWHQLGAWVARLCRNPRPRHRLPPGEDRLPAPARASPC